MTRILISRMFLRQFICYPLSVIRYRNKKQIKRHSGISRQVYMQRKTVYLYVSRRVVNTQHYRISITA